MAAMSTILTVTALVVAAATAAVQVSNANEMQSIQNKAAVKQAELQYKEISRQQGEVNRISQEQKSDRVRKADQELGTLRVLAGERGVSGGTFTALAQEIGYFEGIDLSRIEGNRESNIEAGEAQKKAAQQGAINTVTIAAQQASAATTGAVLNGIGSGLQIGAGYYNKGEQLDALKNRKVQ